MYQRGPFQIFRPLIAIVSGVLILSSLTAAAQSLRQLHGHVPPLVAQLKAIGTLPATRPLKLSIGLPLRNQAELGKFLAEVSDPASPNYRHYLTPDQFAEKFGPSRAEYEKAMAYFRSQGFTIADESANRVLLDVSGSVETVERTFHVTLRTYRHPTENRVFFAPDREPAVDSSLSILDVTGLSDLPRPHSKAVIQAAENGNAVSPQAVGSGPNHNYVGGDFRRAYAPGVTLTGAGQTVALVQFDGYYLSDITNYEAYIGMAVPQFVPLTNVYVDGFTGAPTGNSQANMEVSLDLEMVISMAPGLSQIVLYEGNPNNFFPNDVLNRIATDNLASQVSSSWGWSGGPNATTEQIFQQMMAQGQTYFNASGDSDAFTNGQVDLPSSISQPSSSTNVIQVGGTTLLATNPVLETAWNWGMVTNVQNGIMVTNYAGTCGGISSSNAIPSWQLNIDMTANHGSTTQRNIPDVAMTADNVYVMYGGGLSSTGVGGTSVAAPLWAGFTALINQRAAQAGRPPVGFLNPAIYAIGKSANYSVDFNDVTAGNNFWPSSPTNFPAVTGYDLCTGWGSPNGNNLIDALAIPDALLVTPGAGFSATGITGGPFSTTAQTFVLSNSSNASLTWSLLDPMGLFNASSDGGLLAAGGTTSVTVQLSPAGMNLLPGIYFPSITFTNQTSGVGQDRQFNLQVGQNPVQNGGFEAGTLGFVDWTFIGTGVTSTGVYNAVVNGTNFATPTNPNYGTNFVHSGTYGAALGEVGQLAYLYQSVPTVPGQSYAISFWLDVVDGANPDQFEVNWNTNWPATNTIYNASNIGLFGWSNFVFVVTATGTNTVLQFGARNDNGYFGLDDIAVYPVPVPAIRSVAVSNNVATFSWNAFTNLAYRVQYTTNLSPANWLPLQTNIAPGSILTITNSIGPDPTRFYRLQRLP